MDQRYSFRASGFEIVLDLGGNAYGLGPTGSSQLEGEHWVWPEMGPIPTARLAGYAAQPEDIPGWLIAVGGVASEEGIYVLEGARGGPDGSEVVEWRPLHVLGTHTWHRPVRRKNPAREEPGEL